MYIGYKLVEMRPFRNSIQLLSYNTGCSLIQLLAGLRQCHGVMLRGLHAGNYAASTLHSWFYVRNTKNSNKNNNNN